jgi:hypothetical protein
MSEEKLTDEVVDKTMDAVAEKVEAERAELVEPVEGEVLEEKPDTTDTATVTPKADDSAKVIELTQPQVVPAYKTVATDVMDPIVYQQIKLLANDLINAKALPAGLTNPQQVFVIMWTGREMGMKPFDAVNSLYIVNGAVRIYGKALAGQMRKHGFSVAYKDETVTSATAVVTKGDESFQETFTFEEAEKSKYTKDKNGNLKFGWYEGVNRKLKLRYGALNMIIRTYIPEVLGLTAGIVEVDEDVVTGSNKESIEDKKARLVAELNDTIKEDK